jgi:hypothetical protein
MIVYSTIYLMILIMYYKYYYSFIYNWSKFKKLTYREARMTSILGQMEYLFISFTMVSDIELSFLWNFTINFREPLGVDLIDYLSPILVKVVANWIFILHFSHPTRPKQHTWWCRQVKSAHRSCVLFWTY